MHPLRRIRLNSRPLRPPRTESTSSIRHFARNPHRQRLSPVSPRPQLSFLTPPTNVHHRPGPGQWQLSRLITTEQKRKIKQQAWDTTRHLTYFSIVTVFGLTFAWWVVHELLEREFPTPHEWSLLSRLKYHSAKAMQDPEVARTKTTQWGMVSQACKKLLPRLEDRNGDGKGLLEQGESGEGYDITNMPEPWRRGYIDVLLILAKAAEHLDGMVVDTTRSALYPKEFMIGPSNPKAKVLPPWRVGPAPLEENCVPACESPDSFYDKIFSTRGLTTRQTMDAVTAYCEWLNFTGRSTEAEQKLRWAVDLAVEGVPDRVASIDPKTSIIKLNAPVVTENMVSATLALAIQLAQTSQTAAALPIFLSILRAYRSTPLETPTQQAPSSRSKKDNEPAATDIGAFIRMVTTAIAFLKPVEYPPPPRSGHEPLVRRQPEDCREMELMIYIGEILFATSKSERDTGLNWTREALEMADERARHRKLDMEKRKQCVRCMDVTMENWHAMIERLKAEEKSTESETNDTPRWKQEDKEFYRWVQKMSRDDLKNKLDLERPKLWANWLAQIF